MKKTLFILALLVSGVANAAYDPTKPNVFSQSNNTYAVGTTNDFYDVIVRNKFQQTGSGASNLLLGVTTISNKLDVVGAITGTAGVQGTFFNGTSTIVSSTFGRGILITNSTTATVTVRTTAQAEALLSVGSTASVILSTNGVQTSRYGNVITANSPFTGLVPGDTYILAIGANRFAIGANAILGYTYDGVTHNFLNGPVNSTTNNSTVYQVGGVNGFTGSVTNMESIGFSNIQVFATGILTNVFRIP